MIMIVSSDPFGFRIRNNNMPSTSDLLLPVVPVHNDRRSKRRTNHSPLRSMIVRIVLLLAVCITLPRPCCGQPPQAAPVAAATTESVVVVVDAGSGSDGKDAPEKGDQKCPSLADRYNYFRNASSTDGGDASDAANVWLSPCDDDETVDGSNSNAPPLVESVSNGALPNNAIVLSIYAALPAYASDFRNFFSWGVVGFLDEITLEYAVSSNFSIPIDFFNYTERRVNPTNIDAQIVFQYVSSTQIKTMDASWWYRYDILFYCFYGNAHVDTYRFWEPIADTDLINPNRPNEYKLQSIKQQLNYYLRYGVDIINTFNFRTLSHGILGLSMEDPSYSITPFEDGPPTPQPTLSPSLYDESKDGLPPAVSSTSNSTTSNGTISPGSEDDDLFEEEEEDSVSPPSTSRIDPPNNGTKESQGSDDDLSVILWDWQQNLGLVTLVCTLVSTIILTQLASCRRQRLMKQTIWGNIGTEQGVEALLNTGWKFKDSTLMEVYNKAGMGYRDDDSMLLGGYEQTHTATAAGGSSGDDQNNGNGSSSSSTPSPNHTSSYGIGGEITVRQDGSVTTPES